jgi:hypothetical protein
MLAVLRAPRRRGRDWVVEEVVDWRHVGSVPDAVMPVRSVVTRELQGARSHHRRAATLAGGRAFDVVL